MSTRYNYLLEQSWQLQAQVRTYIELERDIAPLIDAAIHIRTEMVEIDGTITNFFITQKTERV